MTTFLMGLALVLLVAVAIPKLGAKIDQTLDELFDDLG